MKNSGLCAKNPHKLGETLPCYTCEGYTKSRPTIMAGRQVKDPGATQSPIYGNRYACSVRGGVAISKLV